MKALRKFLNLEFLPQSTDLGLLVLRAVLGLTMLFNHGLGKALEYSSLKSKFGDPLGIGSQASLSLAVFGEVVCAALLVLGLWTRFAAAGLAVTMGVAFALVHDLRLKPGGNSGELAFIYLAGFVAILLAGPGRYALDGKGGSKSAPKLSKPKDK